MEQAWQADSHSCILDAQNYWPTVCTCKQNKINQASFHIPTHPQLSMEKKEKRNEVFNLLHIW